MKICHWVMCNNSGMHRVAETMVAAERALGLDSSLINVMGDVALWDAALDADIQVSHTHFPDMMRRRITKPFKVVWVAHGTPEHVFETTMDAVNGGAYGHADGVMLMMNWLRTADACVTFWPRHQWFYKSISDKHTPIHCIPLGVDRSFWKPITSAGKYQGAPSVLTGENCHKIKWPLDLFMLWPQVCAALKSADAKLHSIYLPNDQHRVWFPLINRNGCSYHSHVSPRVLQHADLRNAFNSVDYQIGLVRYGDFNRFSLEANACGTKTISYRGNPYADFWLTEGDQRVMADELAAILDGRTEARAKDVVPDSSETAKAMLAIYNGL